MSSADLELIRFMKTLQTTIFIEIVVKKWRVLHKLEDLLRFQEQECWYNYCLSEEILLREELQVCLFWLLGESGELRLSFYNHRDSWRFQTQQYLYTVLASMSQRITIFMKICKESYSCKYWEKLKKQKNLFIKNASWI